MPIIGLDLGSHNFRAVELEKEKGKTVLKSFGQYENPKIDLKAENEEAQKEYVNALRHFLVDTKFSTSNAVVSLPESEVFTRVINVPKMSDKELNTSIAFEAEQYIPEPLDQVNFSFQRLSDDATEEGKMNVLLVAAKNAVLEKYVHILRQAGLTPLGIEPETLALQRAVSNNPNTTSANIIVNVGYLDAQVIVSYRGYVRFTRTIPYGGHTITKAVSSTLGLDEMQAEEYKKSYGLDESQAEGKVFNAVKPVVDNILGEIRRAKIYYTTHQPNANINKVILAGGTALMPGILFYFANNLDLEVELANPWRNIQLSSKIAKDRDSLMENGPIFVTAVGLALKELQ